MPIQNKNKSSSKNDIVSSEEIELLLSRVEAPISDWLKTKEYRFRTLTVKKAAKHIGISEEDLRLYLKYVVKGSLNTFLEPMRVEEAKILMFVKGGPLGLDEFIKAGFSNVSDYYNAFKRVEGVYPSTWALEQSAKKASFENQRSEDIKEKVKRVSDAIGPWERSLGYRKVNLTTHQIAKALGVSDDDLYYYCCLELHDSIENWVDQQRIYDAKILLISEPDKSISKISFMLGYVTTTAFQKSFEKYVGVTPELWREKILGISATKKNEEQKTNPRLVFSFDIEPITKWKRNKGYCQPNLTPAFVAKQTGFSEVRLKQYVWQVERCSFQDWLTKLRMEEAKSLLVRYPQKEVQEIMKNVGYTSQATFLAHFKQLTGTTPAKWRIEHDIVS